MVTWITRAVYGVSIPLHPVYAAAAATPLARLAAGRGLGGAGAHSSLLLPREDSKKCGQRFLPPRPLTSDCCSCTCLSCQGLAKPTSTRLTNGSLHMRCAARKLINTFPVMPRLPFCRTWTWWLLMASSCMRGSSGPRTGQRTIGE